MLEDLDEILGCVWKRDGGKRKIWRRETFICSEGMRGSRLYLVTLWKGRHSE